MRIDLPLCGLKPCRYCFDGNCTKKSEYDRCEYQAYRALGPVEELSALVKAQDEGRVVAFPEVSAQDRKGMADFLHDCFADWTHDPSVGLYGMTEGEAALANAIMAALTPAEAEAALNGGVQT